jgi:nickel superoxide dismutase
MDVPATSTRRTERHRATVVTASAAAVAPRRHRADPQVRPLPNLGKVTRRGTMIKSVPEVRRHPHPKGAPLMRIADHLLATIDRVSAPPVVHAHCDLPCGVYDPAQARIEAESVKGTMAKYNDSDDEAFKTRAIIIKEERADMVKHHLWVLWTDYFKPEHLEKYPQLHDLFWKATKKAGEAKKTTDVAVADELLAQIADIDKIFWETKK